MKLLLLLCCMWTRTSTTDFSTYARTEVYRAKQNGNVFFGGERGMSALTPPSPGHVVRTGGGLYIPRDPLHALLSNPMLVDLPTAGKRLFLPIPRSIQVNHPTN